MKMYVPVATIIAAIVSFIFAYTFGKAMSDTYALAIAMGTVCLTMIYSRWMSESALMTCKNIATYGLIFFTILTGIGFYAMTAQEKKHPALAEARAAIQEAQADRVAAYATLSWFQEHKQFGNSAIQSERAATSAAEVAKARAHYQGLIAEIGEYEVGPFAILGWLSNIVGTPGFWGLIIGSLMSIVLCCNELCLGALLTGRIDYNGQVVKLGKR